MAVTYSSAVTDADFAREVEQHEGLTKNLEHPRREYASIIERQSRSLIEQASAVAV